MELSDDFTPPPLYGLPFELFDKYMFGLDFGSSGWVGSGQRFGLDETSRNNLKMEKKIIYKIPWGGGGGESVK